MHDFSESLAASHAAEDLPLWGEAYRAAFPGYAAHISHRADGDHQRAGIDRSVILDNGRQIKIDEKIRWRNAKTGRVYDDILLEYWSVYRGAGDSRNQRGWVCKPLLCDFIAYAIAPLGVCYMLPVVQLRLAWAANHREWIRRHKRCVASNPGYDTISVAVPCGEVMAALSASHVVAFTPCEGMEAAA